MLGVGGSSGEAPVYFAGMTFLSSWALPSGMAQWAFWGAVLACLVAQLFIVRAVVLPDPAQQPSPQVPTPRRWVEIVWVILPVAGLVALFLGAWPRLPH